MERHALNGAEIIFFRTAELRRENERENKRKLISLWHLLGAFPESFGRDISLSGLGEGDLSP